MESPHILFDILIVVGGGGALYLLWQMLAELKSLNRHLRPPGERESSRHGSSRKSRRSSSSSHGSSRSSGDGPSVTSSSSDFPPRA